MPFTLNIAKSYKRWRHGHGFGIHSPFGYRFITEVLRLPEEYGYYAYLNIAAGPLRTLFRVAVRFQPAKVAFVGCDTGPVRRAVFEGVPSAMPAALSEADFVVFDATKNRILPPDALPSGANVVIFNPKKWKKYAAYTAALPAGMIFSNGSMAVVAALKYLPRQDFDVKF